MRDSIDFGKMDVSKLFVKLLIPTVMGMVFSAIFIITDGIFVGKGIGSDALAAVNITGSVVFDKYRCGAYVRYRCFCGSVYTFVAR